MYCTYKTSLDKEAPFGEKFCVDFAKLYVYSELANRMNFLLKRERGLAELQAPMVCLLIGG